MITAGDNLYHPFTARKDMDNVCRDCGRGKEHYVHRSCIKCAGTGVAGVKTVEQFLRNCPDCGGTGRAVYGL